ncbi:MAG: hypothetical protein IKJ84_05555 [Oscillospiraceae bacterium]|nr:hypothetical protein [Oscillospiraceae bacterium]
MKRLQILIVLIFLVSMLGCSQEPHTSVETTGFDSAVPIDVSDAIHQTCISYAKSLGYETGHFQKSVLLGTSYVQYVYCEDSEKEGMIDANDFLVIYDRIRCVVDADTNIVLGRIPYV